MITGMHIPVWQRHTSSSDQSFAAATFSRRAAFFFVRSAAAAAILAACFFEASYSHTASVSTAHTPRLTISFHHRCGTNIQHVKKSLHRTEICLIMVILLCPEWIEHGE